MVGGSLLLNLCPKNELHATYKAYSYGNQEFVTVMTDDGWVVGNIQDIVNDNYVLVDSDKWFEVFKELMDDPDFRIDLFGYLLNDKETG